MRKHNLFFIPTVCAVLLSPAAFAEPNDYEKAFPECGVECVKEAVQPGLSEATLGMMADVVADDIRYGRLPAAGTSASMEPDDVAHRIATAEISEADPKARELLKERAIVNDPPLGMSDEERTQRRRLLETKNSKALDEVDYRIHSRANEILADASNGKPTHPLMEKSMKLVKRNELKARLIRGVGWVLILDGGRRIASALRDKMPGYSPAIASEQSSIVPKRAPAVEPNDVVGNARTSLGQ